MPAEPVPHHKPQPPDNTLCGLLIWDKVIVKSIDIRGDAHMNGNTMLGGAGSTGQSRMVKMVGALSLALLAFVLMGALAGRAGATSTSTSTSAYPPPPPCSSSSTDSVPSGCATPPVTPTATPTATVSVDPTSSASGLAFTGEPVVMTLVIGIAALAGGLVLLTITRRRPNH